MSISEVKSKNVLPKEKIQDCVNCIFIYLECIMVTPSKGKFGNILENYLSNWKFYSYLKIRGFMHCTNYVQTCFSCC